MKRLEGYVTSLQDGLQGEYTSNPLILSHFDATPAIYDDDLESDRADRKTSMSHKLEMGLQYNSTLLVAQCELSSQGNDEDHHARKDDIGGKLFPSLLIPVASHDVA